MDGVVGVECRAPKAGALPGCATPRHEVRKDYKALPNRTVAPSDQFGLQLCQIDFTEPSLCQNPNGILLAWAVDFLQSFSLHLQFHLRVAFEDLRVPLEKQLCHPLIGHAARTETSGIRGSQIVNPKVKDLRSSEGLLPNGLQLYLVSGWIQIAGK
jgi:hypothetical protein